MEANGQFHTPATLNPQTRKKAGQVPQLDWMLEREKPLPYVRKRTHSSVTETAVCSVHLQSGQSAPPESLTMKWQKRCPHGPSYLILPTTNPTGIMGS